jgi:uncharacterized repeat protein (TIGR01451 family)
VTLDSPLPVGTTQVTNTATTSNGTCLKPMPATPLARRALLAQAAATGMVDACTVTNPTVAMLDTVKQVTQVNGAAATTATVVGGGDVITYTITVTNTGGTLASTVLTEHVPAHTTYRGATGETWSCPVGAAVGTACTQTVVVSPAGGSTSVTFTVAVDKPLEAGVTKIANTVTTSNGTCSSCSVENPTAANLFVVKQVSTVNGQPAGPATDLAAGDVVVYSIKVTNGGGKSGAATLVEHVPAETTYTGTGQGWSCAAGSAEGTACTQSVTVPAHGSVTVSFTVKVNADIDQNAVLIANTVEAAHAVCTQCSVENPVTPPPLPFTGVDAWRQLGGALALLIVGCALMVLGARRRRHGRG